MCGSFIKERKRWRTEEGMRWGMRYEELEFCPITVYVTAKSHIYCVGRKGSECNFEICVIYLNLQLCGCSFGNTCVCTWMSDRRCESS